MRLASVCCAAAACVLAAPKFAFAQYPERVLRWIVTMPPGGANDLLARPIAQRLSEAIGQQVIVDNRGGAGGNIGAEAAAKAPPDGYTVVMLSISHAIGASLYGRLGYSLERDFAPVTRLAATSGVLLVHPAVPVKSVKQLIALVKARPGQLAFSSSGNGTPNHLAAELFCYLTGVRMTHVPYKGGANSMMGLVTGEVPLSFGSMPSALPHINARKLNAIAVTTAERFAAMPELPTIAEAGVAGYEAETWFGLSVPAKTPKDVIARLHAEVHKALKAPELVAHLDRAGFQVRVTTPEQYAAFTRSEIEKWAKVVKAANIRAD